jgi:glycosyltransferase involved in cell wall biosynthesis
MAIKASIVIPTYNRANLLPTAIESCLNQTAECEVIVVDHGSSDNTKEVVSRYGNRLTYISRKKDNGPYFCWLDGIINANSEYIHLQYDDDWIKPTFIEKTLGLMDDDVGCVISGAQVVEIETGKKIMNLFDNLGSTGIYHKSFLERRLLRRGYVISPACTLFRKQMMLDGIYMGHLPRQVYEYKGVGLDIFFMLVTFLKYKKVGYVNEVLSFFGSHAESITIDAENNKKGLQVRLAYDEYKSFYLLQKFINFPKTRVFILRFYRLLYFKLNKFMPQRLKSFLKGKINH